jgi:hypothetical protein
MSFLMSSRVFWAYGTPENTFWNEASAEFRNGRKSGHLQRIGAQK